MEKYTVEYILSKLNACSRNKKYLKYEYDLEEAWRHVLESKDGEAVNFILDFIGVDPSNYCYFHNEYSVSGTFEWHKIRKNYNAKKVIPRVLRRIEKINQFKEKFKVLLEEAESLELGPFVWPDRVEFLIDVFDEDEVDARNH